MKIVIAMILLALLSACTSRTPYGECVGAFDDRNPKLEYHMATGNVVWAIIFSETIVVPVVVIADESVCPKGPRP